MTADRQGAVTALNEARRTLTHLDRARGGEDVAADIIDLWNSTEKGLRSLAGVSTLSGQQLVRAARQAEVITLDQAHALLEFLAARDRVNRTSYTPTPADSAAAREGFKALDAAVNAPAGAAASPYAPSDSPYAPRGAAGAAGAAIASATTVPVPNYTAPPMTAPETTSPVVSRGWWGRSPLWLRIALPVLLLILIGGAIYYAVGNNAAQSHINAGIDEMQRGQREAARSDFSAAARADENMAEPHIFLARLSREDGDLATARSELDQAIRLEPTNEIALREMGLTMFAMRNYDLAKSFFVRAVKLNANDNAAQGYLGCALMRLNRTAEAAKFLSRAGTGAWSACAQPMVAPPPPA